MAVGQIISRAIATGAIGADQIATGAITAADIPAGEITADKLHQTLDFSTKTFTMANAHVTQAMVTQHQSALSVTESQVSDLQSYVLPNTSPTFTNTTLTGYLAGPASFVLIQLVLETTQVQLLLQVTYKLMVHKQQLIQLQFQSTILNLA